MTFTLRGFSARPEQVAARVGVQAQGLGSAGQVRRPDQSPLKRSYVLWRVSLPPSAPVYSMIPAIITHMGGERSILRVLREVAPEFVEVDLLLPVKDSQEQEGGFISKQDLACLARLGASISFSFTSRFESE